jgi:hypothetical protein
LIGENGEEYVRRPELYKNSSATDRLLLLLLLLLVVVVAAVVAVAEKLFIPYLILNLFSLLQETYPYTKFIQIWNIFLRYRIDL